MYFMNIEILPLSLKNMHQAKKLEPIRIYHPVISYEEREEWWEHAILKWEAPTRNSTMRRLL